jgi:hypothetical protein
LSNELFQRFHSSRRRSNNDDVRLDHEIFLSGLSTKINGSRMIRLCWRIGIASGTALCAMACLCAIPYFIKLILNYANGELIFLND